MLYLLHALSVFFKGTDLPDFCSPQEKLIIKLYDLQ